MDIDKQRLLNVEHCIDRRIKDSIELPDLDLDALAQLVTDAANKYFEHEDQGPLQERIMVEHLTEQEPADSYLVVTFVRGSATGDPYMVLGIHLKYPLNDP